MKFKNCALFYVNFPILVFFQILFNFFSQVKPSNVNKNLWSAFAADTWLKNCETHHCNQMSRREKETATWKLKQKQLQQVQDRVEEHTMPGDAIKDLARLGNGH